MPSLSPLDGTAEMKVSFEASMSVHHKGFLTMFEDVSGFGAWHRRWCYLKGNLLVYWRYPDDEVKKVCVTYRNNDFNLSYFMSLIQMCWM